MSTPDVTSMGVVSPKGVGILEGMGIPEEGGYPTYPMMHVIYLPPTL